MADILGLDDDPGPYVAHWGRARPWSPPQFWNQLVDQQIVGALGRALDTGKPYVLVLWASQQAAGYKKRLASSKNLNPKIHMEEVSFLTPV